MTIRKSKELEDGCHLLKLPSELRNYIWTSCTPRDISTTELQKPALNRQPDYTTFRRSRPAITRTCREIRVEALPLFYLNGPFDVVGNDTPTLRALDDWMKRIGGNVHHVGQVTFTKYLYHIHASASCIPSLYVKLTVKEGGLVFDVAYVPEGEEGSASSEKYGVLTLEGWVARELEELLPLYMFSRSKRLRQRTPGFAAYEWASIVDRVNCGVAEIDDRKTADRYNVWKAKQAS